VIRDVRRGQDQVIQGRSDLIEHGLDIFADLQADKASGTDYFRG